MRRILHPTQSNSVLLRYGVAVAALALSFLLKVLVDLVIVQETPFLLVFAAVMVAAWYGGLGPGLFTTVLAAFITDYFFLTPRGSFSGFSLEGLPLGVFLLEGALVSVLVAELRYTRRQAEEKTREAQAHQGSLRQSEERFRLLVEGVRDYAIFMLDTGGHVVSWNVGAERITGYGAEEIIGEHFSVFFEPEEVRLGKPEQELRATVDDGQLEDEYWRVRKDGSRFWANVVITALTDETGNPRGFSKVVRDITERKRIEDALRESEERFRSLVHYSSDVITVLEADGTIRYQSPSIERVLGYEPEELTGKNAFGYVHPEDVEKASKVFRDFLHDGERTATVEFRFCHKDGSWRYLEALGNNLLRDPGVRGIITNSRDITGRRRAEEALRESEELYRTVIEQAAENIFLIDSETKRVLEWNAAVGSSLGYAEEELRRMTLYDIVAHDRESIDRNIQRIVEEKRLFFSGRQYRRKDGSLMDVEVSASVVPYGGREALCIVAHDVTERKQAEEALRRSLDALLALYETGQLLSSSLEREEIGAQLLNIMRRFSNLSATVIAFPEDDGSLRIWRALGVENLRPKARYQPVAERARHAALETGNSQVFEMRRSGPDNGDLAGLCLSLRTRGRAFGLVEAYGPKGWINEETVETLESLSTQAASALENARLYEELAERESRLKELVGKLITAQEEERRRVAYEIHDGLTQMAVAAYHYLQDFADEYPPASDRAKEELEETIEIVRRAVGEARRVIANLRPTVLDDLGLAAALRQQVAELRSEPRQVEYTETLGEVRLPSEIEIALFRIAQEALTNIRKHAGKGAPVRISLERGREKVRLEIEDQGRGFDPAGIQPGGGPGERVGFSSMRERIALQGGELEIHSEPGAGTSIVAQLPLWAEEGPR